MFQVLLTKCAIVQGLTEKYGLMMVGFYCRSVAVPKTLEYGRVLGGRRTLGTETTLLELFMPAKLGEQDEQLGGRVSFLRCSHSVGLLFS